MKKLIWALTILSLVYATAAYGDERRPTPLLTDETIELIPNYGRTQNQDEEKIVIFPGDMVENALDDSVILTLEGRPFCSGQLAKDQNNSIYMYTAAHCCAVYSMYNKGEGIVVDRGRDTLKVTNPDYSDDTDACRMEIEKDGWFDWNYYYTLFSVDTKTAARNGERQVFVVSPFPNYDNSQRMQSMFLVGSSMENPKELLASVRFYPGMSGSAIVNMQGDLIGHAVAIYPYAKHYISIITVLEETHFLGGTQ